MSAILQALAPAAAPLIEGVKSAATGIQGIGQQSLPAMAFGGLGGLLGGEQGRQFGQGLGGVIGGLQMFEQNPGMALGMLGAQETPTVAPGRGVDSLLQTPIGQAIQQATVPPPVGAQPMFGFGPDGIFRRLR